MRAVSVSDFVPTLRQLVNVPLPNLMAEVIVKAAQAFCRNSKVIPFFREFSQVDARKTINIVGDSELNQADGVQCKASDVLYVQAGDKLLSSGVDFHQDSRDSLYFLHDFDDVVIACAIEPSNGATMLPAVLFDDYLDGICAGAASVLYSQPDSDWFNAELAQYHERRFVEVYREAARFRLDASPELGFHNPARQRDFF